MNPKPSELVLTDPESGKVWACRVIQRGMYYGLDDCIRHNEFTPLVEFHTAEGQFVSRYYMQTLLQHNLLLGLRIDGGVPEWKLSSHAIREVVHWLLSPHPFNEE